MKKKELIYWLTMLLLMALPIITDFVQMGFSTDFFTDSSYWIGVVCSQVPIVFLVFISRSHGKAYEKQKSRTYNELRETIALGYATINKRGMSEEFDRHVAEDNRARKLKAFEKKLNRKKAKREHRQEHHEDCKKRREVRLADKKRKERNPLFMLLTAYHNWRIAVQKQKAARLQYRIDKASERIDYLRVRYVPITTSMIFGEAEKAREDENDLRINERRDIATLLTTKILGIIAFGVVATSNVVFEIQGDWISIIVNEAMSLMQMAISVYYGNSAGTEFIRGEVINRLRKRVSYIQQFIDKRLTVKREE